MKQPTQQTQDDLEAVYSKYQLMPVLRNEFSELANEYTIEADRKLLCEALVQIYLHRQADPVTMVGILSPKFGEPQEVADKLLMFCEMDFIDFNEIHGKFVIKFDLSNDVKAMLDRYQYPLPMVVKPKSIVDNYTTGYHSIIGLVVLNGSSEFKDKDLCLDHLNRANSVALCINMDVVYSPEGKYIKPERNHGEDFVDFKKRLKQMNTFYETSLEVMEGINTLSDTIYMTHKYDRRGRCYSSGYHVNPQGTDYNKSVLQLANKELVT